MAGLARRPGGSCENSDEFAGAAGLTWPDDGGHSTNGGWRDMVPNGGVRVSGVGGSERAVWGLGGIGGSERAARRARGAGRMARRTGGVGGSERTVWGVGLGAGGAGRR